MTVDPNFEPKKSKSSKVPTPLAKGKKKGLNAPKASKPASSASPAKKRVAAEKKTLTPKKLAGPKAPTKPRAPKASKSLTAKKAPKSLTASKAPKSLVASKAPKSLVASKAPKSLVASKAPKNLTASKAPKSPLAPKGSKKLASPKASTKSAAFKTQKKPVAPKAPKSLTTPFASKKSLAAKTPKKLADPKTLKKSKALTPDRAKPDQAKTLSPPPDALAQKKSQSSLKGQGPISLDPKNSSDSPLSLLSTQGFALGEAIKLNLGQRFFGQSLNLVSLALIKVQDGLNFLGFVKDLVKENAKAEPEAKAEPAAKVKSAKKAEPESDLKASSYSAFEPKSRKKPRQSLINPELVKPSGRELADLVRRAALEHKVSSPVLLDLTGLSSVADWFFIASADNSRQIQAAAEKIVLRSREAGIKPLGQEGLGRGETRWALIDLGDVVAHIFNHEARALYDLEGLWADAPRG